MYYRIFLRYAANTAAVLIILIGTVFSTLPIPMGLLIMGIGFALLLTCSNKANAMIRTKRARYRRINTLFKTMQAKLPDPIERVLSKSDPNLNT